MSAAHQLSDAPRRSRLETTYCNVGARMEEMKLCVWQCQYVGQELLLISLTISKPTNCNSLV